MAAGHEQGVDDLGPARDTLPVTHPSNVWMHRPDLGFQRRTVPSALPVATMRPPWLQKVPHVTSPSWPAKTVMQAGGVAGFGVMCHIHAVASSLQRSGVEGALQ